MSRPARSRWWRVLLVLALAWLVLAPLPGRAAPPGAGASPAAPAISLPAERAALKGVVGHWWYSDRYGPALADRYAGLGVTNVRLAVDWLHLEAVEGQRDFSRLDPIMAAFRERGIEVTPDIATVPPWAALNGAECFRDHLACRPNPDKVDKFVQTMRLLVARYPEVRRWEFWNEPEMWAGLRDPAGYEFWYRAFYRAAKQARPTVRVAPSSLTGWDFVGHLSPDLPLDAVAMHSYAGAGGDPLDTAQLIRLHDALAERYGREVPIWLTEYGWDGWLGPAERARAIEWTFRWLLAHPWVEVAHYHMLFDTEESWSCCYGLVGPPPDFAPKQPAYDAFAGVSVPPGWRSAPLPPLGPPALPAPPAAPPVPHDVRYFPATGFRVDDDGIWAYFTARGGAAVVGRPISRTVALLGCPTQFFERHVAQSCPGAGPGLLNLLAPDIFPYTHIGGRDYPAADPALLAAAPRPGEPDYADRLLDFVRAGVPDTWQDQPVGFRTAYFGTLDAATAGTDDPVLLALLDVEVWGAPLSAPAADPRRPGLVSQRFQRGIARYDAASGLTDWAPLATSLAQVLRDAPTLPPDLRLDARDGRFFAQYCPAEPGWLCRPPELPGTDLSFAFEPG